MSLCVADNVAVGKRRRMGRGLVVETAPVTNECLIYSRAGLGIVCVTTHTSTNRTAKIAFETSHHQFMQSSASKYCAWGREPTRTTLALRIPSCAVCNVQCAWRGAEAARHCLCRPVQLLLADVKHGASNRLRRAPRQWRKRPSDLQLHIVIGWDWRPGPARLGSARLGAVPRRVKGSGGGAALPLEVAIRPQGHRHAECPGNHSNLQQTSADK